MPSAFLHPFTAPEKDEADFINIVRAEGSTIWDDAGKSYIDGLASLWYCQVGHGRSEIIDAVTDQMTVMGAYNTFDPFTNDPSSEVANLIAERSPHPDGRVFLGCSGSEAVDTALKIARLTAQRKGQTERQVIIRRERGYHGTNFGGTSAQGIAPNREGWGDLVPHMVEVPGDDIEAVSMAFAEHGDRVAAMITEPVQGAGGVFPPPEGYLEAVRKLCDQHGALMILDEVICGFGRTGSWFGSQTFGVTPDLMTFAKGVSSGYQPLSGVIVSAAVTEVLSGAMLRTGYTYSGHPTCAAAGVANIKLIEAEGLVERATHIGEKISAGLSALAADGRIAGYRGVGGIWAADLGRESVTARDAMLANGVVMRPIGNALAMCPPLVITDDEIATMIDVMADALD